MGVLTDISELSLDIQLTHYLVNNKSCNLDEITTSAHQFYKNKYWNRDDVDLIIPEAKHLERYDMLQEYYDKIRVDGIEETQPYRFYREYLIPTFNKIQEAGLYTLDGMEYTKYNVFTKTGRPSNSNKGINYAALNKEDGTRNKYKTRYGKGRLVEFDYDAYHLRLIANLVGYETPEESFHTHMGRLYFDKDELTPEEYLEAKSISFKLLYGGVSEENKSIEFFALIDDYIKKLWSRYKTQGWVETPLAKRKFYKHNFNDMSPQKLFNYIIQAYETEMNVVNINRVFKLLENTDNNIILYTYDSILIDMKKYDTYIVDSIKSGLKFLTKYSVGPNYGAMNVVE